MTTVSSGLSPEQLQQAARDHLWLHFTRMGGYRDGEVPIIVRGDGCYLEDANGKRYLDALAGLFAVQIGYSYGDEIGEAARAQMRELPFYTNWSYAHPRAIELAAEVARARAGRPEPRLLRLRRLGGGRVGLEARAPVLLGARRAAARASRPVRSRAQRPHDYDAEQAARCTGERRWKAISRHVAYHGTTMGALSINGIPALRDAVRAARARGAARPQHEPLPPPAGRRPRRSSPRSCSTTSSRRSRPTGPETVVHGDHGAGAERRRRVHAARGLLAAACARSATATRSCSAPTR